MAAVVNIRLCAWLDIFGDLGNSLHFRSKSGGHNGVDCSQRPLYRLHPGAHHVLLFPPFLEDFRVNVGSSPGSGGLTQFYHPVPEP